MPNHNIRKNRAANGIYDIIASDTRLNAEDQPDWEMLCKTKKKAAPIARDKK
jgi:hypothetical protein